MNILKIMVIVLIAFVTQASCCGDMDKKAYEELIPPVRVTKKNNGGLMLKDAKDNEMIVQKMHKGWSDSVYRNHKVGDIVGGNYVTPEVKEKKQDDWLNKN